MKKTLPIIALLLALLAGVWLSSSPKPTLHSFQLFALGTLVEVQIADPISEEQYSALQQRMTVFLDHFETRWSVLRDGDLAAVNQQLVADNTALVSGDLREDFLKARQLCQQSHGLFDPAIGNWVALWGFESEDTPRTRPPSTEDIKATQAPSWCDAEFTETHVRLPSKGARLNFGGIAKGRAVDLLLQLLRDAGIRNAIVNAGGDLRVSGRHPQRAWRIGIRDPRAVGQNQAIAAVSLNDGEALFSSGDYERFFEFEGQRYHHLLDPRTGWPATQASSATVLHTDAALADAAATALLIAGPEHAPRIAKDLGVEQWMVIGHDGVPISSAALESRLEWLDRDSRR